MFVSFSRFLSAGITLQGPYSPTFVRTGSVSAGNSPAAGTAGTGHFLFPPLGTRGLSHHTLSPTSASSPLAAPPCVSSQQPFINYMSPSSHLFHASQVCMRACACVGDRGRTGGVICACATLCVEGARKQWERERGREGHGRGESARVHCAIKCVCVCMCVCVCERERENVSEGEGGGRKKARQKGFVIQSKHFRIFPSDGVLGRRGACAGQRDAAQPDAAAGPAASSGSSGRPRGVPGVPHARGDSPEHVVTSAARADARQLDVHVLRLGGRGIEHTHQTQDALRDVEQVGRSFCSVRGTFVL